MMNRVSSIQNNKEEDRNKKVTTAANHNNNQGTYYDDAELYEQAMGTQTQSSALADSEVSFIMRKVEKLK